MQLSNISLGLPLTNPHHPDPAPSTLLHQLGKNLQNSPLKLAYDPIRQRLLIMFSTELRSTVSQELGAALRQSLTSKLTELVNDNALTSAIRDEAQITLDMLTVSYDCAVFNPSTGTREMIIPAVILLADDKGDVDIPLLMLVVDFSSSPDDQNAARLLDMYPGATIIRADIPYLNPKARIAAFNAGNTVSVHKLFYDIIIRSSNAAVTSAFHGVDNLSSSSPSNRLQFLVRNRPLLQQQKNIKEELLEIPLAILFPELAWRIASTHPAAGAAGLLSIQLQHASLRRSLSIAAVRQKNMDILRSKSTENKPRPSPAALPLGGSSLPSNRGLHTRAFPSTLAAAATRSCAFNTAGTVPKHGLADMPRGHSLRPNSGRFGGRASGMALSGPGSNLGSLRALLGFGWFLAHRMRR